MIIPTQPLPVNKAQKIKQKRKIKTEGIINDFSKQSDLLYFIG